MQKYRNVVAELFRLYPFSKKLPEPSGFFQTELLALFKERFLAGDDYFQAIRNVSSGNVTIFSKSKPIVTYFDRGIVTIDNNIYLLFATCHNAGMLRIFQHCEAIEAAFGMDLSFMISANGIGHHCYPILEKLFNIFLTRIPIPLVKDLRHIIYEYLSWDRFQELDWLIEFVMPCWR